MKRTTKEKSTDQRARVKEGDKKSLLFLPPLSTSAKTFLELSFPEKNSRNPLPLFVLRRLNRKTQADSWPLVALV